MSEAVPTSTIPPTGPAHPVRVFLVANFVYLWLVHYWALGIGPSARDAVVFADPAGLSAWARVVLPLLRGLWGENANAFLVGNILLLYACMVGVFFLTRAVLGGAWWLGSLVAVLMMAHPMKSEAVLNLSGVQELLPASCAIWGLLFAVWPFPRVRSLALGVGFGLVAIAGSQSVAYVALPLVVVVLQFTGATSTTLRWWLVRLPWALLAVVLLMLQRASLVFEPIQAVLSLFVVVYPIGLLPTTVSLIQGGALLAALTALAIIAVWLGLWRITRHPAVLYFGLAALLLQVLAVPVDLVDFGGGGTMILPIALVAMGFTAICHRIMQHPAWPRHVVFLTTALCLVLFFLQIQSIQQWKRANVAEAVVWPTQSGVPQ